MRIIRKSASRTKWDMASLRVGQSILVKDKSKFHIARVVASYHNRRGTGVFRGTIGKKGLRIKRVA